MCPEIVHKQVMRVINEEVQGIEHVAVVFQYGHLKRGFNDLLDLCLCLLSIVYKLYTFLLVLLSHEICRLFHNPFTNF